ncbi:MAG: hypothetical protein ACOC22_01885 [bacterium]
MENKRITQLLKAAYYWGLDNGRGKSEKNFNDFLTTPLVKEVLNENNSIKSYYPFYCYKCDTTFDKDMLHVIRDGRKVCTKCAGLH